MKARIREFFPGGNTPDGFHSYYNYILPQKEAEKIFCIKGGPGVGKSTLMKEIALYFSDKEEDLDLFWCSADPNSLDAIMIQDYHAAVLDGTSPHIIDPINPGAVDQIIDLGKYLNDNQLRKNKDQIIVCSDTISKTYKEAYTYLKCVSAFYDHMGKITEHLIGRIDAFELVDKMCCKSNFKNKGKVKKFFGSAISSEGVISKLDSMVTSSDHIYLIDVPVGCNTSKIMNIISDRLTLYGYDVIQLYCPLFPRSRVEHVLIPEAGIGIFTCNDHHGKELYESCKSRHIVKISNDIKIENKCIYEQMVKDSKENIEKAIHLLNKAKKLHDELEEYYIGAMDFEEVKEIKENIIKSIECGI